MLRTAADVGSYSDKDRSDISLLHNFSIIIGGFLRIIFAGSSKIYVAITEVEVYGKPASQ
jgi:hypothetical protein